MILIDNVAFAFDNENLLKGGFMKLVIVESPTKQKTIEKYLKELPDTYQVIASYGHVRDLAMSGKGGLGVDVENDFKPTYKIQKKTEEQIGKIIKLAKKADEVILATDPDREGEAIAWHLAEILKLDVKQTKRIEFYEITKPAIIEAMAKPRTINLDMVSSQEARRILDRIAGFMLSKLLSKKVFAKAAGRVQSVALRFIIEKEAEVLAFQPQTYFTIESKALLGETLVPLSLIGYKNEAMQPQKDTSDKNGYRIKTTMQTLEDAKKYQQLLPTQLTLDNVEKNPRKRSSKAAFVTSTLLQEGLNKLKFNSRKTSITASQLYEGVTLGDGETVGLITYTRTDSPRLSPIFVKEASDYIEKTFGKEYVSGVVKDRTVMMAQDAHEAVRPTSIARTPDSIKQYLTPDQLAVYKMIYNRTIASLMTDKREIVTKYTFVGNDFTFRASGTVIEFPGYSVVYEIEGEEKETKLPMINPKDKFALKEVELKEHQTQGPARYSEAKLIEAMENHGIGRPSTYSPTIERLKYHHYVTPEKGSLKPNPEAHAAIKYLLTFFTYFVDPNFTSSMEKELDKIEGGLSSRLKILKDFYDQFITLHAKAGDLDPADPVMKLYGECPKCKAGVLVPRQSKFGFFLGCSKFPTCDYNQKITVDVSDMIDENGNLKSPEKAQQEMVGRDCPDCGKPLVYRVSKKRRSKFIGCSAFPTCKHIENLPKQPKEDTKE